MDDDDDGGKYPLLKQHFCRPGRVRYGPFFLHTPAGKMASKGEITKEKEEGSHTNCLFIHLRDFGLSNKLGRIEVSAKHFSLIKAPEFRRLAFFF